MIIIKFSNGDIYTREIKDGNKHGNAIIIYIKWLNM